MIYICENCGLQGTGTPARFSCPNCGKELSVKIKDAEDRVSTHGVFRPISKVYNFLEALNMVQRYLNHDEEMKNLLVGDIYIPREFQTFADKHILLNELKSK